MRLTSLFFVLSMLPLAVAKAQSMPANGENSDASAKLLNFSPELVAAVSNCSRYSENFTQNNPDLITNTGLDQVEQQIDVIIKGWQDEECLFDIEYYYKGTQDAPQSKRLSCNLEKDNLSALVNAMQDQSTEMYSETYYINQYDEAGQQVDSIEKNVSGSHFDVIFAQVKDLMCQTEYIEAKPEKPIEEVYEGEKLSPEEFAAKYNLFSPEFMLSLQNCSPNKEERTIERLSHTINVVGKEKSYCHVVYDQFDLNIPFEIISNIHGFDDVKTLLKNKEIAHFNYKPEYVFDGLVHAYNACHNKHSYYGAKEVKRLNDVLITRGMNAEYDGKACIINLTNDVEIEGEVTDYSTMCRLTDKTIEELWPFFEEVLSKYGEKGEVGPNGRFRISKVAIENKETHNADLALMMYMQQEEYCKRPNLDK